MVVDAGDVERTRMGWRRGRGRSFDVVVVVGGCGVRVRGDARGGAIPPLAEPQVMRA